MSECNKKTKKNQKNKKQIKEAFSVSAGMKANGNELDNGVKHGIF